MLWLYLPTPPSPYLLISDDTSNDNTIKCDNDSASNNDNASDNDNVDSEQENKKMVKTVAAAKKAPAAATKKAGAKTTGEDVIDINSIIRSSTMSITTLILCQIVLKCMI